MNSSLSNIEKETIKKIEEEYCQLSKVWCANQINKIEINIEAVILECFQKLTKENNALKIFISEKVKS